MRCKNSGHNVSTESLTPHFLFFLYIHYNDIHKTDIYLYLIFFFIRHFGAGADISP